jgi:hypothetical protein
MDDDGDRAPYLTLLKWSPNFFTPPLPASAKKISTSLWHSDFEAVGLQFNEVGWDSGVETFPR